MKRFLRNTSFIILPLLIIIPLVNYSVDPGHVYGGYEQEVASLLTKHTYVTNTNPNLDHRRLKKSMIDSCQHDVDMLLLGASSINSISEDMFRDRHILNLGVSGASFMDIASILYYYLQQRSAPKTIMISIDPQHFHGNYGDPRWSVFKQAYFDFCRNVLQEEPPTTDEYEKWTNLFSLSYFQEAAVAYLWQKKMEILYNWDFKIHTNDNGLQPADLAEGSAICYDGSFIPRRDVDIWPESKNDIDIHIKPIYRWIYQELSNEEITHWHKFILFIQQQGIKLYLFKTPYHPALYKRAMTDKQYVGAKLAMEYVNKLADEHNVEVIGDYNPATYNLSESDFYDELHVHRSVYRQIFSNAKIE